MFIQVLAPAVVMLEQQLCGTRNIHCAEYRGGQQRCRARTEGALRSQFCTGLVRTPPKLSQAPTHPTTVI